MIIAVPVSPAPINAVSIIDSGFTDAQMVKIDFQSGAYRRAREFYLTGSTIGNATAPGASKTIIVNYYWSDVELIHTTASNVTTPLTNRKVALTAVTVPNSTSATRYWNFSGTTPVRQQARFLYISITSDAFTTGATITLTVNLVPAPSTAYNL